jgi:hypothetical protein
MPGDLGVSTLRSIKPCLNFSSLFGASNQPCCLLQCSGTTLRVRLRQSLIFFIVLTCWEFFSHHVFTRPTFSSFFFWIIIPVILPATMLGYYSMSASLMPFNFFIIVSIYWKSASYRSLLDLASFGKTTNRSSAKLICSFFFWTDVHAI